MNKSIARRFAVLVGTSAVVPLLAYGMVSVTSLLRESRESVIAGNVNVALRAAAEVRRYVSSKGELLRGLATTFEDLRLAPQRDRILKNHVVEFPDFSELTVLDETGAPVACSGMSESGAKLQNREFVNFDNFLASPIRVDDELRMAMTLAVQLKRLGQPTGWLVAEVNVVELWRIVDQIRIGDHGYAMVITPGGELIAAGDPDKKVLVAQAHNMADHPLFAAIRARSGNAPVSLEYAGADGRNLGVAARIAPLDWTVLVEQPTHEAYARATKLTEQLVVAMGVALFGMIAVGYLFGRSFINPILALKRATQAVAAGQLDARIDIGTGDEFTDLGDSFSTMATRLVVLQEEVKRQEGQAMVGRIAAGIVHDLSHPIQNIGNSTALLLRDDVDDESRNTFLRVIEREIRSLRRLMDDLRNLVKPKPIERFAVDVSELVAEIVESMHGDADGHGITIEAHCTSRPLVIECDRFALGRVYRNLITNAIQATESGGRVTIETAYVHDRAEIRIADTGTGIPPERLPSIFDDFVTTKQNGLGLGLPISKRIVEQLGGTIIVSSEQGKGSQFVLSFPRLLDSSRTHVTAA